MWVTLTIIMFAGFVLIVYFTISDLIKGFKKPEPKKEIVNRKFPVKEDYLCIVPKKYQVWNPLKDSYQWNSVFINVVGVTSNNNIRVIMEVGDNLLYNKRSEKKS